MAAPETDQKKNKRQPEELKAYYRDYAVGSGAFGKKPGPALRHGHLKNRGFCPPLYRARGRGCRALKPRPQRRRNSRITTYRDHGHNVGLRDERRTGWMASLETGPA